MSVGVPTIGVEAGRSLPLELRWARGDRPIHPAPCGCRAVTHASAARRWHVPGTTRSPAWHLVGRWSTRRSVPGFDPRSPRPSPVIHVDSRLSSAAPRAGRAVGGVDGRLPRVTSSPVRDRSPVWPGGPGSRDRYRSPGRTRSAPLSVGFGSRCARDGARPNRIRRRRRPLPYPTTPGTTCVRGCVREFCRPSTDRRERAHIP